MAWSRKDWLLLLALTVLAAGLRFYQLGQLPPGFQFDEAFNAMDARLVLQGSRPLFLPANAGREVLYTYFQAGLAALFGLNVTTLRLASAILGTLAIPTTYLLYRRILQHHSRTIAAGTALTLAISLWHVHFSRYGIRVISMPVLFSLAFGFAWLGTYGSTARRRALAHLAAGLLIGLSVWTHPTGRLAPFVLIGFALWLLWRHPSRRRIAWDSPIGGLVIMGSAALLVFLPLGIEFLRHPEFFFGHASEVSIFAARVGGDFPLQTLLENILHVLGMFSIAGDQEWTHNLAGRPVFDLAMALPFYLGLMIWGKRLADRPTSPDQDALALLACWTLVMLFPSILSDAAPNYSRMMPALPALFTAAGLGLDRLFHLTTPARWFGPALTAAIVLFSTGQTVVDYFVRFAAQPKVYYMYDADKLDALDYLRRFTGENQVYLSQLWGDHHATVRFLRSDLGIKSVDTGDTVVLPPAGQGAIYAFPAEQQERAGQLASLWGVAVEPVLDPFGSTLLYTVRITPDVAAEWPPGLRPSIERVAHFTDAPTLLGMQADQPDKQVTLFWRSEAPMAHSLTTFVHLLDRNGQRVGQVDKLPGNGSYPTTAWTPGERIIDRAYPIILDRCIGGETVRVQVGWYDLATPDIPQPRADATGHTAPAGELTLPRYTYPPQEFSPQVITNAAISPTLTLLGYTLHNDALQPGSPFTIDLMWHSLHSGTQASPAEMNMTLELGAANGTHRLWSGPIAPTLVWDSGQVYCARLHPLLPDDITAGEHPLRLLWTLPEGEQDALIGTLTIGPSTRRFDLPTLVEPVDAFLTDEQGGRIRLVGASEVKQGTDNSGSMLNVTLVWQAVARVEGSYQTFVHLLDADGAILAQSDSLPAAGYTTNRWVPDEVVLDVHRLTLPADFAPGSYRLVAGMYESISGRRLSVTDAAGNPLPDNRVPFGQITLTP